MIFRVGDFESIEPVAWIVFLFKGYKVPQSFMAREHEYGTRMRLLRVMLALLDQPFIYTKRDLAHRMGYSLDTIKDDFECFKNAGMLLEHDSNFRYGFTATKPYQQLKHLLHFTEDDQYILEKAIDSIAPHSPQATKLKKKLSSLYDYHLLGHSYLRKPYLDRVEHLMQAQKEKVQVILVDYPSSNSNETRSRRVEPFHPSPPDDILHAFDVEKGLLRHFRISRMKRVKLTHEPWAFEGHHQILPTDPFRIVSKDQVMVHLRLSVGARNELIERYPMTRQHIEDGEEKDTFDFQGLVNARFIGITNYLLGTYLQGVEIIAPDSLRSHLQREKEKMFF